MPKNAHGPLPGSSGPSLVIAGSDNRAQLTHQRNPKQALRLSAELDELDLELLHSVELLIARGGAAAVYAVLAEIGMRALLRTEIELCVRRHLHAGRVRRRVYPGVVLGEAAP